MDIAGAWLLSNNMVKGMTLNKQYGQADSGSGVQASAEAHRFPPSAKSHHLPPLFSSSLDGGTEQYRGLAERLDNLLRALPAAVVVLDGNGVVEQINPAAEQLLLEDITGMSWRDVVLHRFEQRRGIGTAELRLKDGRIVTLSTCPRGSEPGQVLLFQDVTENRRLQLAAQRQKRLAEMGRMVASLAHQIRTPLSSALLYASHLKRPILDEDKRQRFSGKMITSLRHLERLINDMLIFARGGIAGEVVMSPQTLLVEAVRGVEERLMQCGIELQIATDLPDTQIRVNPTLMKSALQNLMNNALDAMGEQGLLSLAARVQGARVELSVADTGKGIAQERLGRIFEPFESDRTQGTGLGLPVVRAIVQAHRGTVRASSTPGVGSRFVIEIPRIETRQQASDSSASKTAAGPV